MIKRLVILALLVAAIAGFFMVGLGDYLSLDALKASKAEIDGYYALHPVILIAVFFVLYVAVTAASLPGAAIMTLAAGAIFGLVTGTVIVSFASTIGATLAFLASRNVLGEWVQARFGDRLTAFNEGVARDGAYYLFSLRLVPLFPFFVVNLLMGLTPIRTWTYMWVSQLGMLLGTIVFVNAGTQLAQIDSLAGIASPMLLGSFFALAALPWLGKGVMALIARRRAA